MAEMTLKVSEVFYSLQGEGARAGEPSIFIRLQGCSAKYACARSGVVCDTEFESGKEMTLKELDDTIYNVEVRTVAGATLRPWWIVWTGGEPLDQLTPDILRWFKDKKYMQAIETSGIKYMSNEISTLLDWIVCSPKVAEHILEKNFKDVIRKHEAGNVDELRYVRHAGQPGVPVPALHAQYYYLSPHTDGQKINQGNLRHCIKLCLENPMWRLSVQQHKLWQIL